MATTVDLGKVRPVWKGAWSPSTAYEVHDMVKEGVDSYICTTGHTSGNTFSATNWDYLSQGAQLPAQTGNSGKALITDGSNLSWGDGGQILQFKQTISNTRSSLQGNYKISWDGTPNNAQGINVLSLSVTPLKSSSESRLIVWTQVYSGEWDNTDGGTVQALWADSTLLNIQMNGKATYSAYSEGPSSFNRPMMGILDGHTAGTAVNFKVNIGGWDTATGKNHAYGYVNANIGQYATSGTTSVNYAQKIWVMEVLV